MALRRIRVSALFVFAALASGCHGGTGPLLPVQTQDVDGGASGIASRVNIESTTTSGIPTHVMTAGLIYGYGGTPTSVPVSKISPYLTWAQTSSTYARELRSAGLKVAAYVLFWRNYEIADPDIGYEDIKPGSVYSGAEIKTCSGAVIKDNTEPGGGYPANPMNVTASLDLAHAVINASLVGFDGNYDALMSDDTGSLYGLSAQPCNLNISSWVSETNEVDYYLGSDVWVNALNSATDATTLVPLVKPGNVLGAICESCYVSDYSGSDEAVTGTLWTNREQAEIDVINDGKTFWVYPRATGSASSEIGLRLYAYASFLLTYAPTRAMIQEGFKTPSGFEVFPETGLVPENPEETYSTVASYVWSSRAYGRKFADCYYRGVNKGECAVVINPNTFAVTLNSGFAHSMLLEGYGVIDANEVYLDGPAITTLKPGAAAILFH